MSYYDKFDKMKVALKMVSDCELMLSEVPEFLDCKCEIYLDKKSGLMLYVGNGEIHYNIDEFGFQDPMDCGSECGGVICLYKGTDYANYNKVVDFNTKPIDFLFTFRKENGSFGDFPLPDPVHDGYGWGDTLYHAKLSDEYELYISFQPERFHEILGHDGNTTYDGSEREGCHDLTEIDDLESKYEFVNKVELEFKDEHKKDLLKDLFSDNIEARIATCEVDDHPTEGKLFNIEPIRYGDFILHDTNKGDIFRITEAVLSHSEHLKLGITHR